ncbi:MAG: glycosyltransferase family 2 protein [Pseudomonadota bacterium]
MAEIAVIIVNYNAAALTIDAVESVLTREHGGRSVEVHVLDNASPNGDGALLRNAAAQRRWGARVRLHLEAKNHGFAQANNLVLSELLSRSIPPAMVFLLNPDAVLKSEAIDTLAKHLEDHPETAIAGARVENPGECPATSAFRFPSLVSAFSEALAFGPIARLLSRWQVPLAPKHPTAQVDWVAGCAAMLRVDALREIGLFDSDFFLYFEEVELCRRARTAGWQIWHVAEAEVIHIEGTATGIKQNSRHRRPPYWYRSWAHYFRKTHGRFYALATAAAWMLGALLNLGISKLRRRRPAAPERLFADFWAAAGRPLLGLEARSYE